MPQNYVDAKESVFQGQAGTGRAFILPNALHDPLAAGIDLARREQLKKDELAKAKAAEEKARKEKEMAAFLDPEYSLNRDVTLIQDDVNKLNRFLSDSLARNASGLGGDPLDPSTKEGRQFQEMKTAYMANAAISKNDNEWLKAITEDLNANPQNYAPGAKEAIAGYLSLTPAERAKQARPNLDMYFDRRASWNEAGKALDKLDAMSGYGTDSNGNVVESETEFVEKNRGYDTAFSNYMEPRMKTSIDSEYASLSPEELDRLHAETKAINTERKNKGLSILPPEAVLNYNLGFKDRASVKRKTIQVQQPSEAGLGRELEINKAKWLVNLGAGVATGNYEGYEPVTFTDPAGNKKQTNFLQTDALSGATLGEGGHFAIDRVFYDKETGRHGITVKPSVTPDKLTPEEQDWWRIKEKQYGPEGGKSLNREAVIWKDPKQFYSEIVAPVAFGNKEIKEDYLLQYLDQQGIDYTRGEIDITKLDPKGMNISRNSNTGGAY